MASSSWEKLCLTQGCSRTVGPDLSRSRCCKPCRVGYGHSRRCDSQMQTKESKNLGGGSEGDPRTCLTANCSRLVTAPHKHCCSKCKKGFMFHKDSCDMRQALLQPAKPQFELNSFLTSNSAKLNQPSSYSQLMSCTTPGQTGPSGLPTMRPNTKLTAPTSPSSTWTPKIKLMGIVHTML